MRSRALHRIGRGGVPMPVRPPVRSFAARNQPKRRPPDRRAVRTAFFVRSALGCRWMRHFECGGFAGPAVRSGDGRIPACRSVLGPSPSPEALPFDRRRLRAGNPFGEPCRFPDVPYRCEAVYDARNPVGEGFRAFWVGSATAPVRYVPPVRSGCGICCDVRKRRALFFGRRGRVVSAGQNREDWRCGWVPFS